MNTTKLAVLFTLGGLMVAWLVGCGSQPAPVAQTTPQIVVVTATATVTPQIVVVTATPAVTPTVQATDTVTTTEVVEEKYPSGTLLKGTGEGVFYVTEQGSRQHIYDWTTFLQLGFQPEAIIEVSDKVLENYPLEGELSRLLMDKNDGLYWVSQGQRWLVMDIQPIIYAKDYQGPPPTLADDMLLAKLPIITSERPGPRWQHDDTVFYQSQETLVPLNAGMYSDEELLILPDTILAQFTTQTYVSQTVTTLKTDQPAANVRSGPGADFEVIGSVTQSDTLTLKGQAKGWYQMQYQDQLGWIASNLIMPNVAVQLLPPVAPADLPQVPATPTPTPAATATPKAIYCDTIPLRGFGVVWGNHLEVQNQLGCPNNWGGGEQGTKSAAQIFQHGIMLWLEADTTRGGDPVYVFFDDGSYQRFNDAGAADPTKVGTVPAGFKPVGDKFSKIYWEGTGARVKERLGYATSEAADSAGAFQLFTNGRMFWNSTLDRVFVIYDYWSYDENNNYIRIREWQQYEDTF